MTAFRWVIGIVLLLSAVGALASLLIYVTTGIDLWIERTRRLRRWVWLALLLWFNVEVWGRVIGTLVNWSR